MLATFFLIGSRILTVNGFGSQYNRGDFKMKTYDINDIQFEMQAAGSHWWDRDTMRHFSCRVSDQVYQGPGGIYFVTSERTFSGTKRYFTVRQYDHVRKSIDTIGDFNSLSRATAHKIAQQMAQKSLQDQFDEAMCELDKAVTGKDKSKQQTLYGSVDDRDLIYLSDGGYTRVSVHEYDDSSGYYLSVHPTFADEAKNEEVKSKFSSAYKLQQEVCRVLGTTPAGETAKVVAAAHKEIKAEEQLAIDLERNGCTPSEKKCKRLIQLATNHHKAMEDYCNGTRDPYDSEGEDKPWYVKMKNEIADLAFSMGCTGVKFSGDPRGCTVKLILPNEATNDFGKEGWCVPTLED